MKRNTWNLMNRLSLYLHALQTGVLLISVGLLCVLSTAYAQTASVQQRIVQKEQTSIPGHLYFGGYSVYWIDRDNIVNKESATEFLIRRWQPITKTYSDFDTGLTVDVKQFEGIKQRRNVKSPESEEYSIRVGASWNLIADSCHPGSCSEYVWLKIKNHRNPVRIETFRIELDKDEYFHYLDCYFYFYDPRREPYSGIRAVDIYGKIVWSNVYLTHTNKSFINRTDEVVAKDILVSAKEYFAFYKPNALFVSLDGGGNPTEFDSFLLKVDVNTGFLKAKHPRLRVVPYDEFYAQLKRINQEFELIYPSDVKNLKQLTDPVCPNVKPKPELLTVINGYRYSGSEIDDKEVVDFRLKQKFFGVNK